MESHARSVAKALSYRLLGSITTAMIFLILTGDWKLSAGAGAMDTIAKLGLYFLHERVWNVISFGRPKSQPPPEYEI